MNCCTRKDPKLDFIARSALATTLPRRAILELGRYADLTAHPPGTPAHHLPPRKGLSILLEGGITAHGRPRTTEGTISLDVTAAHAAFVLALLPPTAEMTCRRVDPGQGCVMHTPDRRLTRGRDSTSALGGIRGAVGATLLTELDSA